MMNIAHWIEKWAVATPDKTAIRFEGREISYREFNDKIKACARMLKHELGVNIGDRIAYLGQNDPQILIILFACARLGAILVPLNWRLAPTEHLHMLRDSGSSILFVDELYLARCDELKMDLAGCKFVSLKETNKSDWLTLSELMKKAAADEHCPQVGMDSPILIIYTSGTTGFPKGAVLSQEAIQFNAFNSTIMHDMSSQDSILTFLPLFHVGGLNVQTLPGFYAGATIILHRAFDAEQAMDAIANQMPDLTIILPAHMPPFEALPDWKSVDFSSLRSVITGSTTIPDKMIRFWHGKGIPLLQMYGSSETCPIAIHQTAGNAFTTEGSIGFPAMHCDIRIIDNQGNDCDIDVPGEILMRGKNVMSCYWNNEAATNNALQDGWFHSSDIGYVDKNGCYHFVDRKNDIIISGGENIYPAEIENILMNHSDIQEVAIVGRDDARWEEVAVAVIVTKEGCDLDKEQVLSWLEGKLGRYKHPRDILFIQALPRNEMRKVMKHELRELVSKKKSNGEPRSA